LSLRVNYRLRHVCNQHYDPEKETSNYGFDKVLQLFQTDVSAACNNENI
jgi:hypothetical protein